MSLTRDADLINALYSIPSSDLRAVVIKHLHPCATHSLCEHLKKLVYQHRSHRLPNEESRNILQQTLRPHSRLLRHLFNKVNQPSDRKRRKKRRLDLQKGKGIFTLIASAVIPVIVDLISRAASSSSSSKKKKLK